MVPPSLDAPTIYTAVDLETALGATLKKQESELREMEERKRELQELSKQQKFRPSNEVSTFKIIKSVKELVAATVTLVDSAKSGFLYIVPADMLLITEMFGINEEVKRLVERGGHVKGISDISYADIAPAQEVRHWRRITALRGLRGVYFAVVDEKHCVSAINVDIKHISLKEPVSMLWTDGKTYADYLTATFEILWERSVPAAEQIQKLLAKGPPQA
jgi:sugar-specific transcriptional regulator TrmB